MNLTSTDIIKLLRVNDKAVARALVVLNNRQLSSEQRVGDSVVRNGRGFRPAHARMGTAMAEFYTCNKYLTAKQISYWRATDKNGNMRIGIYHRQLLEEAAAKASQAA